MSDVVRTWSSPYSSVNCVVTTPDNDDAHLLTTDIDDKHDDDDSVDRNGPIPYPLRVAGASIGTVCLLTGVNAEEIAKGVRGLPGG